MIIFKKSIAILFKVFFFLMEEMEMHQLSVKVPKWPVLLLAAAERTDTFCANVAPLLFIYLFIFIPLTLSLKNKKFSIFDLALREVIGSSHASFWLAPPLR